MQQISETPADIVVFSDFRHGMFNRDTIPPLTKAIPEGAFRVADSQVASRWGNILEFHGFDLITPNEREARFALGRPGFRGPPAWARAISAGRMQDADPQTRRARPDDFPLGPKEVEDVRAFFAMDSFAERVVDAVGSGDALLAYAALSIFATGNSVIGSVLGSLAAAVECEHEGNVPVRPKDVIDKLDRFERFVKYQ